MPLKRALLAVLVLLLMATSASPGYGAPRYGGHSHGGRLGMAAAPWQSKVEPWVLERAGAEPEEFLVFLAEQADLSAAAGQPTKRAKGRAVYETLTAVAARTQAPILDDLRRRGIPHRSFWVANMVWVRGDLAAVQRLAMRSEVSRIYANPVVRLAEQAASPATDAVELPGAADAIEWNIAKVRAPEVWSAGFTGEGVVIGGQDTGYQWDHPALKRQYRGWDGTTASHDYNWHDAIHSNGACQADSPFPCDDHGHGTHTMGTMVGDDGAGNRIGTAPGARWIGCRNMNGGVGTPATYAECYQWFIAPTKRDGSAPDPAMAPDVINNSWGCPPSEGCTEPNVLLAVVQAVRAAGIMTVHSGGNGGPACGTVSDPAATYAESFSVGATDSSDAIAAFSSRGPVTVDGSGRRKPDVSAPGVSVRSSLRGSTYATMSGTSMAGPHVAGAAALLLSAYPWLAGEVDTIENLLEQTATPRTTSQACGGDTPASVPNHGYGWGRIDALAAYNTACSAPGAVGHVAISLLDASTLQLSWDPSPGATAYEVWSSAQAPHFTPPPGAVCASSPQCVVVTTPAAQLPWGGPDSAAYQVVLSSHRCGATTTLPSHRTGSFRFELAPGE